MTIAQLRRLEATAQAAVTELRDLAHGIYPPILVTHGLAPALDAVLRGSRLRIRAQLEEIGRRPPEQEAAVYFCCREALQNVGKHAGPGVEVEVVLQETPGGGLQFCVSDSGCGFSTGGFEGQGLVNMRDRRAAVGGTLEVWSSPGSGTRVTGRLPAEHVRPVIPRPSPSAVPA